MRPGLLGGEAAGFAKMALRSISWALGQHTGVHPSALFSTQFVQDIVLEHH